MARTWRYSEPIVLASASPRRLELLSAVADDLTVIPADIDESRVRARSPRALVRELSRRKALAVAGRAECEGKTVIGADTVVYLDKPYGKPRDRADAVRMISELGGRTHRVYTGVTVVRGDKIRTFSVMSEVTFRELTREEIERYVDGHRPYDKAGGYAIQEGEVVKEYRGSYTNIVGLPMERLGAVLRAFHEE